LQDIGLLLSRQPRQLRRYDVLSRLVAECQTRNGDPMRRTGDGVEGNRGAPAQRLQSKI
jgi:hypothetical protein